MLFNRFFTRIPLLGFLFLILSVQPATAADFYWVGGGGDWSDINHWATASGGTINHITVPSPYDDVIFDANSFINPGEMVNMNLNIITCSDFNCLSVTNDPTFFSGINTTVEIYGSLLLIPSVTFSINSQVFFQSSSTGNLITSAGHSFTKNVYFDGPGGEWTLGDDLMILYSKLILVEGSLITNSKQIQCKTFESDINNTRTLTLGNSNIYISQNWSVNNGNLTLNAGTSTIYISGPAGLFNSVSTPAVTYHNLVFNSPTGTVLFNNVISTFNRVHFYGNANIMGNVTYTDMVATRGKYYYFELYSVHTFVDSLVALGHCLAPIQLKCNLTGHATFSKASGTLSVDYVKLKNIHTSGNANFLATNSQDEGNNTGWTITPPFPQNLYWVNGSGNWTDTAHWSHSSGGPSGACPPTAVDNVFFDDNSFQNADDSVTQNSNAAACHDMTWNVSTGNPAFRAYSGMHIRINGSLQLQSNMEFLMRGITTFGASVPGKTIFTGGHSFEMYVMFNGTGGGWTLLDSLIVEGQNIGFKNGDLNTNGMKVSCHKFLSDFNTTRTLSLGESTLIITASDDIALHINGLNMTLNSGTSLINMPSVNPAFEVESGQGLTFYDVHFSDTLGKAEFKKDGSAFNIVRFNANAQIVGNTTVDTFMFTAGCKYEFRNNTTHILNQIVAKGKCNDPIFIITDSTGSPSVFNSTSDTVDVFGVILRDIQCTGSAVFNAWDAVDLGNNNNWNFFPRVPRTLYWVEGDGMWSDSTHWSLASGGIGGECIPTPVDDVVFDHNSFIDSADAVYIDVEWALCEDMSWINPSHTPVLDGNSSSELSIWGSLLFADSMTNEYSGIILFEADTAGKTITSNGVPFNGDIFFVGNDGEWTLIDSLILENIAAKMEFYDGTLNTNQQYVRLPRFYSISSASRTLDIENSVIEIASGTWIILNDSMNFKSDQSLLLFSGSTGTITNSGSDTIRYNDVYFEMPDPNFFLTSQIVNTVFRKVTFNGHGLISGNNVYDTLIFSKGKTYYLGASDKQKVNELLANSDCYEMIRIQSTSSTQAFIQKLSGTLEVNFVKMSGIHGLGNATFHAINSDDLGNNTNWIIDPSPSIDRFWVGGSGQWHDTTHWSYSSGGMPGACIPTRRDDVYFDSNSFSMTVDTVRVYQPAECRSMDWAGATGDPIIEGSFALDIYGSLNMIPNMLNKLSYQVKFKSDSVGNTINTAGHAFQSNVFFNGNGEWTFVNDFAVNANLYLEKGNIISNDYGLICFRFLSDFNTTRSLDLGASIVEIKSANQGAWNFNGINLNLNPGTSNIIFPYPGGMYNHEGNDFYFHNVYFIAEYMNTRLQSNATKSFFNHVLIRNSAEIKGENTFDSLTFFPDNTYSLDAQHPQHIIDHWYVRGNNCFPIRLESTATGFQAEVTKSSGSVVGDFITMRDIEATGGASFFAGANSSDIANNSGWTFNNAPSYVYGLPTDTFLIKGNPLVLTSVNFNGGVETTYLWSTGDTTGDITVTLPGIYSVTVTYDTNCVVIDSIQVYCGLELGFNVTDATCPGYNDGSIDLTVLGTPSIYNYIWSNGDTLADISYLLAGIYTVTVTDSLCEGIDSAEVFEPPIQHIDLRDTIFCEDDSVAIDAGPGYTSYQWQDGSYKQQLIMYYPDSIWLVVTDSNGCISPKFEAYVEMTPLPEPDLQGDTCVKFDAGVILYPGVFEEYLWQNASTLPELEVVYPGIYFVKVTQDKCSASDTIEVTACPPELTVPNVFTPNGDGYNDEFIPESSNIVNFRISIFNRWGELMFESDDVYKGWDGRRNNQECSTGTYFYKIEYEYFGSEENTMQTQGSITLLR